MRFGPAAFVTLLFSFGLLAGCLDDTGSDDGTPNALADLPHVTSQRLADPNMEDVFATVIESDHFGLPEMHHIRSLHTGLEHGIELVGWNPLTDKLNPGAVGTGWGAAGLWSHYACVAQFAGTGAIAIVDIEDPAAPEVLAQVDDPLVNGDCQFTADGKYMFAGAYLAGLEYPDLTEQPICPQGCPAGGGINVWNVEDKSNPVHILYTNTGEYHTLQLHTDADTNLTYVIQAYSGNIYRFDPEGPSLLNVYTLTPMEHDMWLATHPVTGQSLLYTGSGAGFVIYDFDEPEAPELIAEWVPESDALASQETRGGCCGWHRQATVDQLIDGKAILVVAGEACGAGYTLPYYMIDITDPTAPVALSQWEIPGKPESTDAAHLCEMSPHEFAVHDGYVVTGNYHAGVWLFDIGSAERLRDPVTLGYYVPSLEPVVETLDPFAVQDLTFPWNPFVWGAFFDERGYILAGDFSSGVYILDYPGLRQQ